MLYHRHNESLFTLVLVIIRYNESFLAMKIQGIRLKAGENDIMVASTRNFLNTEFRLIPVDAIGGGEVGRVRRMAVHIAHR